MGRGLWTAQITLIICYQIELDKLNIYETLTCSIPKMCWFIYIRFCTASSHCVSLSSTATVWTRKWRYLYAVGITTTVHNPVAQSKSTIN
jgi:hypothetical protein